MEKSEKTQRTLPAFGLKRESVQQLGVEELSVVVGGATAGCCLKCDTDGTGTTCRCPPAM